MQHRRIIKQGPVVLAMREDGSMDPSAAASQGLFLADTRFLSRFQICINGVTPIFLGSTEETMFESSFLHTNPELTGIAARSLGILQRNAITEGKVRIEITLANWSLKPVQVEVSILAEADFYDSFEARGVKRLKRGTIESPEVTDTTVELRYLGLDSITRISRISCDPAMSHFDSSTMHFPVSLDTAQRKTITLSVALAEKGHSGEMRQPNPEIGRTVTPKWFDKCSRFSVSNNIIGTIVQRSIDDIEILMTEFPHAWMPAAGLPRFSVPFGRDSIITGLETLIWNHHLSRDVLRFLSRTQGTEENPWNYEQPGKIMHEMHTGELAHLKEVPFGLFYGSVDSTPLFLVLGAEYIRWTGDLELWRELKPSFEAAWKWIEEYGNIDGSGYVQYKAHTPPRVSTAALTVGLFNQGWKDSATAVMYGDGTMVTDHPISLAEVQGDLYRALQMWGELYVSMPESEGMQAEGHRLLARAAKLKEQFNREFWMPDKHYYAMALDGSHRQVDSITSNPGECLWSRLIDDEHAEDVARTLLSDRMFSSWGIRTMASTEPAYNPISYHNGSVWPFENALIATGLKKYGFVTETQKVIDGLIDASLTFEYRRWPEVYCGVSREIGGVLARQPDASRPQAWSAGAIFLLLQTILGIAPRPFRKHVDVTPALPACLNEITIDNLSIGGGTLGLRLVRENGSVLMEIRENPDDFDIVVHPAAPSHHHPGAGGPAISK